MDEFELIVINKSGPFPIYYDRLTRYGVPARGVQMKGLPELEEALAHVGAHMQKLGWPVDCLLSGGMYVARKQRGSNRPSRHSFGDAGDIDGVVFKGEHTGSPLRTFMALDSAKNWRLYLAIEAVLRRYFGLVLNTDYNVLHRDHWHCELSQSVKRTPTHSRSETLFIQRAIFEFGGVYPMGVLTPSFIDGVWGPKTEAAFKLIAPDGLMSTFLGKVEALFPLGSGTLPVLDAPISESAAPAPRWWTALKRLYREAEGDQERTADLNAIRAAIPAKTDPSWKE